MTRQVIANLNQFLETFPKLIEASTSLPAKLLGGGGSIPGKFPGSDHNFYWQVKGRRGPLLCTTFPYRERLYGGSMGSEFPFADESLPLTVICEPMIAFADRFGFAVEIEPVDVPDFYYPGATVPIIWSKRGVNWRELAGRSRP